MHYVVSFRLLCFVLHGIHTVLYTLTNGLMDGYRLMAFILLFKVFTPSEYYFIELLPLLNS